jgi:hypothetical protein
MGVEDSFREGGLRVEDTELSALAWSIAGHGAKTSVRAEAPVEIPGWEERPWIEVRALTEAENLERESLGLVEEYELVTQGLGEPQLQVTRRYDLLAMARYDFEHCVVGFLLPETLAEGQVVERRMEPGEAGEAAELLERMQPLLAEFVWRAIEAVNLRQPEQRAAVELVKKS